MAMSDALRKRLQERMDRRSFLRGSGLAAAAFVGAAVLPLNLQSQAPQSPEEKPKEQAKDDQKEGREEKKDGDASEVDPFKETKKDAEGRDYRMCPQCGFNMYKQDRTWTCENCGYSYVE